MIENRGVRQGKYILGKTMEIQKTPTLNSFDKEDR